MIDPFDDTHYGLLVCFHAAVTRIKLLIIPVNNALVQAEEAGIDKAARCLAKVPLHLPTTIHDKGDGEVENPFLDFTTTPEQ